MNRYLAVVGLAWTLFAGAAGRVAAEEASQISVPGGIEGSARVLAGVRREPEAFLYSLNRVLLAEFDLEHEWKEVALRKLYSDYLADLERLRESFPGGIEVGLATGDQRKNLERLAGQLGYRLRLGRGAPESLPKKDDEGERRRRVAYALGWDPVVLLDEISTSGPRRFEVPVASVPSPWPVERWSVVTGDPIADPLRTLVRDQRLGLVLEGRRRSTPETSAAIGTAGWNRIYRKLAIPFFRYAPALRLTDGSLAAPGGEAAIPIWQELVGESLDRPEAFLLELLDRKGARAAYLWHTLSFLPERDAAFYLGVGTGGGLDLTRQLFRRLDNAERSDFDSPIGGDFGFGSFVRAMPLNPERDGFALPGGPGLWFVAGRAADLPSRPAELARLVGRGLDKRMSTSDFLLETLTEKVDVGGYHRPILPRMSRAANLFRDRPDLLTPENVILIVRSSDRVPSAFGVLEELSLDDPSTVRDYLLAVAHLAELPSRVETELLSASFQGGAEWLRQMAFAGRVASDWLEERLRAWSRLHQGASDPEAVAAAELGWIAETLSGLPAGDAAVGRGPFEAAMIRALVPAEDPQRFTWNALDYEGHRGRDLAEIFAARLARLGIPSADQLAAADRSLTGLATACAGGEVEEIRRLASEAQAIVESLPAPAIEPTRALGDRLERIAPIDRPKVLKALEQISRVKASSRQPCRAGAVGRARQQMARELRPFLLAPAYLAAFGYETGSVLDDPLLVHKHLMFSMLAEDVVTDNPWSGASMTGQDEAGLGAFVTGHVGEVTAAVAEFSRAVGASPHLFRDRIWLEALRRTRWHELSVELVALVADLVRVGKEIERRAASEIADGADGPSAGFASARVPRWRLGPGRGPAAGSTPLSPSEHLMLGLAAFAGDGQGGPWEDLGAEDRRTLERRRETLGADWRGRLDLAGVATTTLDGRARPWVGSWPAYEAVESEKLPAALYERQALDLKIALLAYLGRHGLPGEIGRDLYPRLLRAAVGEIEIEHLRDWESSVRWTSALDDERFDHEMRECLRDGLYRASGF